jgi:chromosome segregation ATPase
MSNGMPASKVKVPSWPDQNGPEHEVYAWDAVGGDLASTSRYGNLHSYTEDLKSLVAELDESEQQARDLRIKLAEKDGFLGRMMERERMLKADLEEHKTQLAAMVAHRQAVKARMDRLKEERQQAELDYEKHSMDSAQRHIATTINSVEAVSSALDSRIERTDQAVRDSIMRETEALRRSLQPDVAAGDAKDEGALQAVAASAANMPAPATFLQTAASLRGA